MFQRPRRSYTVMVLSAVVAFAISGVGGEATPSSDAVRYWVGATGWTSFALVLVATVLYTLALGVRALARHRTGSATITS